MQTVNFQCGHCGNLMAVSHDFLGKQVRCPHCQEVVVAPAQSLPPTPPPPSPLQDPMVFLPRPVEDHESIFGEVHDDDLFGRTETPQFAIPPPVPALPRLDLDNTSLDPLELANGASPVPGSAVEPPTIVSIQSAAVPPSPLVPETMAQPPLESNLFPAPGWVAPPAGVTEPDQPVEAPPVNIPAAVGRRQEGAGPLASYLLIILLPYAIVVTIVALFLYLRTDSSPHPLETLPDNIGDHPGSTRKGSRTQTYQRMPVDGELSGRLRVPLGKSIKLGVLEILPTRVEQKPVVFCYRDGREGGPSMEDALVLHLTLTNTSKDIHLFPTDPAFNRWWKEGQGDSNKPYTFLEAGLRKRFYGGPFPWPSRESGKAAADPDNVHVQGQESDNQVLEPGQKRTTVVCTDPKDRVGEYLRAHPEDRFLWRVHLRRGLVQVRHREVPATGVIGVEFTAADIKK